MPTNYPGALDTIGSTLPDNKANSTLTVDDHASHHNNLADALIAVETALGISPAGSYATVAAAILNKVDLSPGTAQVILPTADVVGLTIKQHNSADVSNLFETRLSTNALAAYIDKTGVFSAQALKIAGTSLASTHLSDSSTLARLAGPALTGTPTAPTAAVDTNTTQIATTAFVLAQAASASPVMDGTAAAGTATRFARADHVHPTDTSRAPVNAPTFTGLVTVSASGIQFSDATTMTTAALGPSYGTAFPGSPSNGQEHVLVDSTTNPSYQWRFRYNSSSTSPYKWEFVGGAPAVVSTSFTLPVNGDFYAEGLSDYGNGGTTTAGTQVLHLQYAGVDFASSTFDAASSGWGGSSRQRVHTTVQGKKTGCSSASAIALTGYDSGPSLAIWPVRCS